MSTRSKLVKVSAAPEDAERRLSLALRVLDLLNRFRPGPDTYRQILEELKEFTDFEAVGLRLTEGDDYPYYFTYGFDNAFVEAENHLCIVDDDGECLKAEDGSPVLECMCGNIIRGRTNPELEFFSKGGSFWSNNTTHLLATTTDEERQAHTRNHCNAEGYETVVLVPLKSGEEVIGLLQFNDRRTGRMTAGMLAFLEGLGASIGIALARNREQQALVRKASELKRSNEDLRQFTAVASHDLQEPLRTITSFGQLLEKKHGKSLDEDGLKLIHYMISGASRLHSLIGDLLTYSNVEGQRLHFESVDCNAILSRVREALDAVLTSTDGKLVSDGLPTISGDRSQVFQLFQNLVANGLKFRTEGVRPKVEVSATQTEAGWLFKFADNGIGIAPRFHEHVFQMFKRLHSRDSYSGTGIGLPLCRKIVQRHGGRIWIDSELDQGTTVCVLLPPS